MIKENINKVDGHLKELFDSVNISETQQKYKYYFDIKAEKVFENKKVAVHVQIEKPQLESKLVTWRYFSNPNDVTSFLVERVSDLEHLALDINDVVVNKKLDSDYLRSIELINESKKEDIPVEDKDRLVELMQEFGVQHLETLSVVEDNVYTNVAYFKHTLRRSDMQRVEMALESGGWNKFFWNEDKLLIKYYN